MASHGTVASATGATLFYTATRHGFVTVKNEDATIKIFIGTATVTNSGATAGVSLAAGASMQIPVLSGTKLYASSASGTPSVSFIATP